MKIDLEKVETLGELLLIALTDLNELRLSPNHSIDMNTWFTKEDDICHVCLAGSTLVSNAYPISNLSGLMKLSASLGTKMYALNSIRNGAITLAVEDFYGTNLLASSLRDELNKIDNQYSEEFPKTIAAQNAWIIQLSKVALKILEIELKYKHKLNP